VPANGVYSDGIACCLFWAQPYIGEKAYDVHLTIFKTDSNDNTDAGILFRKR
jgi:hypothetical protein